MLETPRRVRAKNGLKVNILYILTYVIYVIIIFSFFSPSGTKIPGSAVLVFDVHIIDFHNPSDSAVTITTHKPEPCDKLTKKGDFIKYHYNATLMDGSPLDST